MSIAGTSAPMPIASRALAAALLAVASACGGGQDYPEPVTEIDVVDSRRETVRAGDVDPYVVGPAATPRVRGRIIYEPPVSLAEVAAADTLVRRANTGTTDPQTPQRAATGQSGAARDTTGSTPSRPERR
jgi:hypothetical protein